MPSIKHATVARRAVRDLATRWRGDRSVWNLYADTLVGIAVAWDIAELESPRTVPQLAAKYLDTIGRIVEGCIAEASGDGDGDTWGRLAAELGAGAVGAAG